MANCTLHVLILTSHPPLLLLINRPYRPLPARASDGAFSRTKTTYLTKAPRFLLLALRLPLRQAPLEEPTSTAAEPELGLLGGC